MDYFNWFQDSQDKFLMKLNSYKNIGIIFDQSPVSIQTKFKSKLLTNFYKMSGKIIESCFICSSHAPRSSCYNVQIGYSTFYCCTIECNTVVNAFFYARSHYKWA